MATTATELLLKANPAPTYSAKPPSGSRRQRSLDRSSMAEEPTRRLLPRRGKLGRGHRSKGASRSKSPQELSDNQGGRNRTVFYSLRQTGSLVDCGFSTPGAPPATPLPAEQPVGIKYVLSLQDTRSKRELSLKLTEIREKRKDAIKQLEQKTQSDEREREQERITRLRIEQRSRIYALNQLMTQLEFKDFQAFRAWKNGMNA